MFCLIHSDPTPTNTEDAMCAMTIAFLKIRLRVSGMRAAFVSHDSSSKCLDYKGHIILLAAVDSLTEKKTECIPLKCPTMHCCSV